METNYSRSPRRRRRGGFGKLLLLIFTVAAIVSFGWFGYLKFIPSNEQIDPKYKTEYPIVIKGIETTFGAKVESDLVKLPLPLLEDIFSEDKPIHYEKKSGTIVFTSTDKVLRLKTDALTGIMNQKPYKLTIAAEVIDDVVYIPTAPLEELLGLRVEYNKTTKIVTLLKEGDVIQHADASPKDGAAIRVAPSIREPYLLKVKQGDSIRVWEDTKGWLLVQSSDGHIGYLNKKDVQLTTIEEVPKRSVDNVNVPWKVKGSKINLTWEAVYNRRIDPTKIGEMPGVNVVSPTWFKLLDEKGTIEAKADPAYVKWAHERGYQVWALFDNAFKPDLTTVALSTVESRFNMIKQLLAFAQIYNLQGINVDFENVHTKDKENLVQFMKEMTPLLHEQGLVVSIDVTPKSNSEMWSVFLDRAALGKVVDYMMVMAYDEHWGASPKSGSVASLPWTERSIKKIMEEDGVPANKIVLSMPLYTRVWTEKADETGAVKVSSKAIGMEKVKTIIAEKQLKPIFDEAAGQNYVEFKEDGALKRIWIEDDTSMKARVEIVHKYDLAGVATWARSFQTPSIWQTIDNTLTKKQ
ncbi:glycosyl hydrolase [Paenibacillus sp. GSMTC-2017]|uniref:glycosyl hydrolase family 18 protein n=1 Tax=Paenibacillus sp. GSMTC-2017 TaxID=2794350 RepID=UPI0018D8A852|nr:glycosyl hydrolase family 18 protein [Paenibacillus sp. GSMTC-2017]MBH5320238.1 glycosyl hydrolase [Paenibacillus sp. GSMTC-2017]